jgi:hypothetical protein
MDITIRCSVQNRMWNKNRSYPLFPVTESPPSHAYLGTDADKHWVVLIAHIMGTYPGHIGCPSEQITLMSLTGTKAASNMEQHHFTSSLSRSE